MDKCWNHLYLVLLQDYNPFFYCLDGFLFHLQASQIPTGGSKDVGKEYTNAIHFHPMFYRCIMDKRNHFYLVFHKERNPFFSCNQKKRGRSCQQHHANGTNFVRSDYDSVRGDMCKVWLTSNGRMVPPVPTKPVGKQTIDQYKAVLVRWVYNKCNDELLSAWFGTKSGCCPVSNSTK